jgi:NAD(P)-dependent dehydrogenase (short-subunit alcohol dehydrogenase family)
MPKSRFASLECAAAGHSCDKRRMTTPIALVTGANTGIGFEIARGLLERGMTVVLGCRDLKRGEVARADLAKAGKGEAVLMQVDLANLSRLRNFVPKFLGRFERLDLLVHNAGVWPRTRRKTEDGFELTLGVNHLGPFFLTDALLPLLEKSAPSRIVVVTSSMHTEAEFDFEDPQFKVRQHHGGTAYAQSKLANVLFTRGLARRLDGKGVTVNAVHPGVVNTGLRREAPPNARAPKNPLSPREGAVGPLHLALSADLAKLSGRYFEGTEQKTPSPAALDVAAQDRLWALSRTLLKLPPE